MKWFNHSALFLIAGFGMGIAVMERSWFIGIPSLILGVLMVFYPNEKISSLFRRTLHPVKTHKLQ